MNLTTDYDVIRGSNIRLDDAQEMFLSEIRELYPIADGYEIDGQQVWVFVFENGSRRNFKLAQSTQGVALERRILAADRIIGEVSEALWPGTGIINY